MLNILNLGAGVQSTTVLLMACEGKFHLDMAIFADTQWEPKAVYKHLEWLETHSAAHGIPVHRVTAGNLREDMLAWKSHRMKKVQRARMPLFLLGQDGSRGILNRQCTSNYKVKPIERFIKTEVLKLDAGSRWPKQRVVRQWFGISADEFRRAQPPVRRNKSKEVVGVDLFGHDVTQERERVTPIAWRSNCYPLCDTEFIGTEGHEMGCMPMTRQDCLQWLAEHGYPTPPRSACKGCPFHCDAEWVSLKSDPDEWQDAVEFDAAIRDYDSSNNGGEEFSGLRAACFVHADRIPLDKVQLTDNDMPMFQCGNGICGV